MKAPDDWTKVNLISDEASDSDLDAWYETYEYEGFDDQTFPQWLKQNTSGKFFMYADNVRFEKAVDATLFSMWWAGQ